jgi:adenylyl-sulfate kinase
MSETFNHPIQSGRCYWFTGLSGAGKTSLTTRVQGDLAARGLKAFILDGDHVRQTLNSDLGFGREARRENIRRIAEVAKFLVDAGEIVLVAAISPFADDRELARRRFAEGAFFEVFVAADIDTCKARDPKGLYAQVQGKKIDNFTGLDAPYEPPVSPDLTIDTTTLSITESVLPIIEHIWGGTRHPIRPEKSADAIAIGTDAVIA